MSDDQENYKGFNKKHLKKAYDNKKKARRNKDEKQNINKDISDEEESLDENGVTNVDVMSDINHNDGEEEEDTLKSKKMILKSKNYIDNDSDEEDKEYQGILSKKSSRNSTPKSQISNLKSTFSPTGSIASSSNDFGFGNDNDFGFMNGEQQLNNEIETEIHIRRVVRRNKANRFDTVVIGLNSLGEERVNQILKDIKKKLGIGGCITTLKDFDEEPIMLFSGDYTEKIKNFLMEKLGRSEEFFHTHS